MSELTELGSGSQVASLDTEHTLYDAAAAPGVHHLIVDVSVMQAGDEVVLRQKGPGKAAGTQRILDEWRIDFNMSVATPVIEMPIRDSEDYISTLEQTDGTGRTFPWSCRGYENA